jgi:hypothetical protein
MKLPVLCAEHSFRLYYAISRFIQRELIASFTMHLASVTYQSLKILRSVVDSFEDTYKEGV